VAEDAVDESVFVTEQLAEDERDGHRHDDVRQQNAHAPEGAGAKIGVEYRRNKQGEHHLWH
jgi:hypothetical protein